MTYAHLAFQVLSTHGGSYEAELSTLSLKVLGRAQCGDWLEAHATTTHVGRCIGSLLCSIAVDGIRIAVAEGAFRLVEVPPSTALNP